MKLITTPTLEAAPAQALDQLWQEAEMLGDVSAEKKTFGGHYEATISFARKSGTRIYAKGKGDQVHFALAAAINEAREMGAGVQQ
jgi:hypothetical protein